MKKLLSISLFFVLISNFLNAQVYQRGYYIDLNKDTIRGEFFEELPYQLAEGVVFRKEQGSETAKLKPSQIEKFYTYRSATTYQSVDYSFKHERGNTVERKYFAKQILSGYYSLYKIEFNGNPYIERYNTRNVVFNPKNNTIYVLKKGKEEHQLEWTEKFFYKEGKELASKVVLVKQYLQKLHPVVADCPETLKKLEDVEYTDKDLIDIVLDYNVCKAEHIPNVTLIEFETRTVVQKQYLAMEYANNRTFLEGNEFGLQLFMVTRKDNRRLSTILGMSAGAGNSIAFPEGNYIYSNLKYTWQFSFLKHSEVDVYGLCGIGIKGIYTLEGRDKGASLGTAGEFGVGVAYNSVRFDTYVNIMGAGFRAAIKINEKTEKR